MENLVKYGAAMLLCLATIGAASADIMFDFSSSGTGDNVNFQNGATGTTIVGTTQQSNTNVLFTGNETLATQASGQARITGSADQNLNFIEISLQAANSGFTSLVFNLNGLPQQSGSAIITAFDQFGTPFIGTITSLGPGQNFVTILASNGELITDVTASATANFGDIEQVRLGGAVAVPGPVVGASLPGLLVACGFLVIFARRRRSSKPTCISA
jgi:hypothetical protein